MSHPSSTDPIDLKQWRYQIFPPDWNPVTVTLRADQHQQGIRYRDGGASLRAKERRGVERSRHIPISDNYTISLVVSIQPDIDQIYAIVVEFWPTDAPYLPGRLRLSILDDRNDPVIETYTRDDNQKVEMKFSGEEGDRFQVRMILGDDRTTISFII